MTKWTCSLGLLLPLLFAACLSAGRYASAATAEQRQTYQELRKDFFVAMALPGGAGRRLRSEHRRYLRAVTAFIKSLTDEDPAYKAAAHYFRARMLMRVKRLADARKDFDACLGQIEAVQTPDAEYPAGLPCRNTIRIYRAFTFLNHGTETVLTQLDEIPDDPEQPQHYEVGGLLTRWADALAEDGQVDSAIRAYGVIKRFDLWEDEIDNPDKRIELLNMTKEQQTLPPGDYGTAAPDSAPEPEPQDEW